MADDKVIYSPMRDEDVDALTRILQSTMWMMDVVLSFPLHQDRFKKLFGSDKYQHEILMHLGLMKQLSHMILTRDRPHGKDFPTRLALIKANFDTSLVDEDIELASALTISTWIGSPKMRPPPNTDTAIAFGAVFWVHNMPRLLDFPMLRLEPPLYRHVHHDSFKEAIMFHEMCHCFSQLNVSIGKVGKYRHLFAGKLTVLQALGLIPRAPQYICIQDDSVRRLRRIAVDQDDDDIVHDLTHGDKAYGSPSPYGLEHSVEVAKMIYGPEAALANADTWTQWVVEEALQYLSARLKLTETPQMLLADAGLGALVERELQTHHAEALMTVQQDLVYAKRRPLEQPQLMITRYLQQKLSGSSLAAYAARR
jgi:hypothetical protein